MAKRCDRGGRHLLLMETREELRDGECITQAKVTRRRVACREGFIRRRVVNQKTDPADSGSQLVVHLISNRLEGCKCRQVIHTKYCPSSKLLRSGLKSGCSIPHYHSQALKMAIWSGIHHVQYAEDTGLK
ncbi:unnamed protein product [Protopolystoma xenopodis]|uniref:Uncharacterized protein n=1 Tax=Protopolystoma xenopodis TaxID=117903 RepID=A0A448WMJ6_9PLAT|nr:unnamed protein product [Protopolystoma xenopodis]